MSDTKERRKITAEFQIPMDKEFVSPEQFIKDIKKLVKDAKSLGYTTIQVTLASEGEYEDRYDYPAIWAERMETDEEYNQRQAALEAHRKRQKDAYARRLEKAKAEGFTNPNQARCQYPKCAQIIKKSAPHCPFCGMVQLRKGQNL